jgi:O-antigen/teichoic acid export membrane protein
MAAVFKVHHTWEDWVGMALGVVIGFSPWYTGQQGDAVVSWNAVIVGALVLALAALELAGLQRWEEVCEIVCGLWLVASPFMFGYIGAGTLGYWHFVLGVLVALLAAWELWQDWKLSDKELARHGE